MKTFLLLVATALLLSTSVLADIKGAPFSPEVDARFNTLEGNSAASVSSSTVVRVARAVWNPSLVTTDGDSTTPSGAAGVHSLGVSLPAKAIITSSYMYVVTKPVSAGGLGKLSFKCEDAANIYPTQYWDNQPVGKIISGAQAGPSATVGASANMTNSIAAACDISAVVTDVAFTAGKVIVYVSYVVAE